MNLTHTDIATLQKAHGLLQSGQPIEADALLAPLAAARVHPDGMHLHALVLQALGKLSEARNLLSKAITIVPGHPHYLNSLGNVLDDLGEDEVAVAAFQRAIAADPNAIDPRINLALVQTRLGDFEAARVGLDEVLVAMPKHALAWNAKGQLARAMGDPDEAARCHGEALKINPADNRARHNRASALWLADNANEALAELDTAIRQSAIDPATLALRGHVLGEMGHFEEAIAQYRALIEEYPGHCDAHETLALLLPQVGRGGEALDAYRTALSVRPNDVSLWRSAIGSARSLKATDTVLEWADQAEKLVGRETTFSLARAWALGSSVGAVKARDYLLELLPSYPDDLGLATHLSHFLIASGDPAAAAEHALRATRIAPFDQTAWSHLTVIWRLLDDPREHWLADYERLVMPFLLEPPSGYATIEAFLGDLEETLVGYHTTQTQPAEQSLRGGTQTRGLLFNRRQPHIKALVATIHAGIVAQLAKLPEDPSHPFLARNMGEVDFAGSWSVRLKSEGFHIDHFHPEGWLSSACYIALPPEVGGDDNTGALQFGVPDSDFGLDLTPRRIVTPEPGKLVLFPSYFWHGTLPFESDAARLTVAFDALPRTA